MLNVEWTLALVALALALALAGHNRMAGTNEVHELLTGAAQHQHRFGINYSRACEETRTGTGTSFRRKPPRPQTPCAPKSDFGVILREPW
jgi:hypothetical protein